MHYGAPDRLPYFEEGLREDTLLTWGVQVRPVGPDAAALFKADEKEEILCEVEVDALAFSEPVGSNTGALISPCMYEDLVLPSYEAALAMPRRYGVGTIICRTYANIKALIPSLLKWGIDCLWACEVEPAVRHYPSLRQTFGPELELIGGFDLDALRKGPEATRNLLKALTHAGAGRSITL